MDTEKLFQIQFGHYLLEHFSDFCSLHQIKTVTWYLKLSQNHCMASRTDCALQHL